MLDMVLDTVTSGQMPNAYIVPVTINYEKTCVVCSVQLPIAIELLRSYPTEC
eukprot:SAG22_NODE_3391_length_1736_cov_2.588271_4_plen_52_part_00